MSVESQMVNLCLLSYTYRSNLSYIYYLPSGSVFGRRIRIHKGPESTILLTREEDTPLALEPHERLVGLVLGVLQAVALITED